MTDQGDLQVLLLCATEQEEEMTYRLARHRYFDEEDMDNGLNELEGYS